jgi:inorganic pyrophosphatase
MAVDLRPYLGAVVTVTVDRPLGSRHPEFPNLRYPINYGYVPGTLAGDGEPIDAYILGVAKPVTELRGVVIALVVRTDDDEDKLVVAPPGHRYSIAEVERMVWFQERFFASRVVGSSEQAVGGYPRRSAGKPAEQ